MDYIKEIKQGADVGYGVKCSIHPQNREGCVGKNGIDKNYTIEQVILLARRMEEKPNIIIKAGKNAKWYLKKCAAEDIQMECEKQQEWRPKSVARCTMYIIEQE